MPSVLSFKDELARCNFGPLDGKAMRGHLRRWEKDGRSEEVWAAIKRRAPGLEAAAFIQCVLDTRHRTVLLSLSCPEEDLDCARRDLARRVLSASSFSDLVSILEVEVERLRVLEMMYLEFSSYVSPLRKRQWREAELFVHTVGDYLHIKCGRRFDAEVAILAEIAFPGRVLNVDQIKTWRQRRHGAFRKWVAHAVKTARAVDWDPE